MVRAGNTRVQFLPKTTEDRIIGKNMVCRRCERESSRFKACSQEHARGVVEMLSGLLLVWQIIAQVQGDD